MSYSVDYRQVVQTIQEVAMKDTNMISVREAAEISGYGQDWIRMLLTSGKISGEKFGFAWAVHKDSLERYLREQGKTVENG